MKLIHTYHSLAVIGWILADMKEDKQEEEKQQEEKGEEEEEEKEEED